MPATVKTASNSEDVIQTTQQEETSKVLAFEQGEYPYEKRMTRKEYEAEKAQLQA